MLVKLENEKWRYTRSYSSLAYPLVITRTIEEEDVQGYFISHKDSGLHLGKPYAKLSQARTALALTLHLADWTQDRDTLAHTIGLGAKVRQVQEQVLKGAV